MWKVQTPQVECRIIGLLSVSSKTEIDNKTVEESDINLI